jgi:hypothetical protein
MYTDNLIHGNLFAVFFKGKRVAGFWKIWHRESIHIVHLLHQIPVEFQNGFLYSLPEK